MKICAVAGCPVAHHAAGYCRAHYGRFLRHGDPVKRVHNPRGSGGLKDGYRQTSIGGVRKRDHVRVAEKALGKPLPEGAVVHHWNEDRGDNASFNLLICPDRAYHNLIHMRMAAMAACGNPDFRVCKYCKTYDDTENLRSRARYAQGGLAHEHVVCARLAYRDSNARRANK